MANPVIAGIKDVGSRVFGGYAELLRIPHTARYAIGAGSPCSITTATIRWRAR